MSLTIESTPSMESVELFSLFENVEDSFSQESLTPSFEKTAQTSLQIRDYLKPFVKEPLLFFSIKNKSSLKSSFLSSCKLTFFAKSPMHGVFSKILIVFKRAESMFSPRLAEKVVPLLGKMALSSPRLEKVYKLPAQHSSPLGLFTQSQKVTSPAFVKAHTRKETLSREESRSEEKSSSRETRALRATQEEKIEIQKKSELRRNKEGREDKRGSQDEKEERDERKKGSFTVASVSRETSSKKESTASFASASYERTKPILEPPQPSLFALSYMLDKMSISIESLSYLQDKEELEALEKEESIAHKKMIDHMKVALKKERSVHRWSIAIKIFAWIQSLTTLITGIVMIATGAGAIAGSLLIVGSVLTTGTQIMDMTKAWNKIAQILPGDDDVDRRRAVVTWIQIGIMILSLIICGIGIVMGGGFSAYQGASKTAMIFTDVFALSGKSISDIGSAVDGFLFKKHLAKSEEMKKDIIVVKYCRDDLSDRLEESPDRLLQLYESIARELQLLDEVNAAFQHAWR